MTPRAFFIYGPDSAGHVGDAAADRPGTMGMSTLTMPTNMDLAVAPRLDHLRALETESIQILREVVAEF